ncbi:MAG: cytochrome ubiquinol oxidase subunit I [Bacteroidaceae bacterium]|jgi:cytochrome d ubiquinol oxidase subunit I|nr:cytochrome ubiquinol oxidase subunit I [Bacteroidaceae bacterium]
MENELFSIDGSMVDWSRAQFALTAIYHWLFVPLTLGLAVVMGIMETIYYRTKDDFWKRTAQFWQRLFGINFAMGIATGIILEFEFGTNWSNYSFLVGDVFGAPLAIEGIVAFFMESTFVAVMFFGWKKVSRGFHLASTWLTGLGATISAWWILVANSWMQYPVGQEFNLDTMRNEMVSFVDVALSPVAIDKFCHTVISAWVLGAVFVVGVSSWYLLKRRHVEFARQSMKIGAIVGLVASVLAAVTGHHSAYTVGQTQPMKLAAMEALYNGGDDQSLTIFAAVNPFAQPDWKNEHEPPMRIAVPYALSFLATNDLHGYVPGINDIINGYDKSDGEYEVPLSEKMVRGSYALTAMKAYREAKRDGRNNELEVLASEFQENMPWMGYGYVKEAEQIVPYIPICFWSFRIMVGGGCLFILLFCAILYFLYRKKSPRWLFHTALWCIPVAYIVSECGWLVAEFGRQPWTIQDMLPTWVGVSALQSSSVMITFFLFLVLFTTMLAVEISIMCKQIKRGPEL